MDALRVVEGFDVFEDFSLGMFEVSQLDVIEPFLFQRPEEAFHGGVVVTATSAAHRALDAQRLQQVLISVAGVLAAAVAMSQQVAARVALFDGSASGLHHQVCV